MKKLKLEVESLNVESFDVVREDAQLGTVKGREYSSGPLACDAECHSQSDCVTLDCITDTVCETFDGSCNETCNAYCDGSWWCGSTELGCTTA